MAIRTTRGAPNADPWALVWGQPYIDHRALATALEEDLAHTPAPDFRTRLLLRDAARALQSYWGTRVFEGWLRKSPAAARLKAILEEDLGEPGFPHIKERLVASVNLPQIEQIFDLLGQRIHDRVEITLAGSIPTLLQGLTARPTADIDVVNEIPKEIRSQRATLHKIKNHYGLTLGHVQSHDLPAHWEARRQWLGDFGGLRVYLVDVYDVFVSKLSSKLEKHQQDLVVLAQRLDKATAKKRLLQDGQAFCQDPSLRPQLEANWRFIYRESLFPEESATGAPASLSAPQVKKRRKRT